VSILGRFRWPGAHTSIVQRPAGEIAGLRGDNVEPANAARVPHAWLRSRMSRWVGRFLWGRVFFLTKFIIFI
jgi:hypothetical protein